MKKNPKNGFSLTEVIDKSQKILDSLESKKDETLIKDLANKLSVYKLVEKYLSNNIAKLKPLPCVFKTQPLRTQKTLFLAITDIHIGKKTTYYNFDVFCDKLAKLTQKVIKEILDKNITDMVIFLGGDLVEGAGTIYPGQMNHICLEASEQAIKGAEQVSLMIHALSKYVTDIQVKCVSGNHGRIGRKGEGTLRDNWDHILYQIAKVHLKNISNVSFEISEDWKIFCKIQDLILLLIHGDDSVSGNPVNNLPKAIIKWGDMFRKTNTFDAVVTGHWHLPVLGIDVNGRELFINGTMTSPDEYIEKKIKEKSQEGQICFIVEGSQIKDRNLLKF